MNVDEFVLKFVIDPSGFLKGGKDTAAASKKTKDQVIKDGKELEAQNKKAAESFASIKREALGLFAVVVGAGSIKAFTQDTVTGLASINRSAKAMGESAQNISAFRNMIKANGDDANAAASSLANLTQVVQRWKRFGVIDTGTLTAFSKIHAGPNMSALQIFQRFAQWSTGKDAKDVQLEGQMLGFDQGSINEAIKGGPQAAKDFADAMARSVNDQKTYDNMQKLLGAFNGLRQEMQKDGAQIIDDLSPALTVLLDDATKLAQAFPNVAKGIMAVVVALGALKAVSIASGVLGGGGGGAAAAAGGGGAALGVAGPLGGLAAFLALPLLTGNTSGALAYQKARKSPGSASDQELAAASAYVQQRLSAIPAGPAGDALRRDLAAANSTIQNEIGWRGGAGKAGGSSSVQAGLIARGINPTAAAGAAAGIAAEGGTPTAFNPAGGGQGAFGIGQWRGSRLAELRKRYGSNPSMEQQLDFLAWELKGGDKGGASVLGAGSATQAMMAYIMNFMRPGAGTGGDLRRGMAALGGGMIGASYSGHGVSVGTANFYITAPDAKGAAQAVSARLNTRNLTATANQGLV